MLDCEQSLFCSQIRKDERKKRSAASHLKLARATKIISVAFSQTDFRAKERLITVKQKV